jgi:hypothetical protein
METRVCKRCGIEKSIDEFYTRSDNNKLRDYTCKQCRKDKIHQNYLSKIEDDAYVEKERKRGREKYVRLGYNKRKTNACSEKEKAYPSLRNARRYFNVTTSSDMELHHWNYNVTDSVILLNRRLHHRLHTSISLDLNEGIYYRESEKLDSLEKHLNVIKSVCEDNGFDFSSVVVLTK